MGTSATSLFPGLTFEVAFGTNMKVAASSWTDLTTRVRDFSLTMGRDRELDEFRTGQLTVVLDNTDRHLDPEYSSGPYFGGLIPMVQARLRVTYSAVTYDLFYGYIQGWPQSYPGIDADQLVTLEILDGFAVLAAADLPDSVWAVEVKNLSPTAWYRMGEERGQQMADSSGNAHHGTYGAKVVGSEQGLAPYPGGDGAKLFDGIDDVGVAPLEVVPSSGAYSYCMWLKMPDEIPTAGTTVFTAVFCKTTTTNDQRSFRLYLHPTDGNLIATNDEHSGVFFSNPRYSNAAMVAKRTYFVAVTYDGAGDLKLYIDGVEQTEDGAGHGGPGEAVKNIVQIGGPSGATFRSWQGVIDEVAFWSGTELSAAEVDTLYDAGVAPWAGDSSGARLTNILDAIEWPASLRDIDTGTSLLGPTELGGKAFEYIQQIAATEAGLVHCTGAGAVRLVGRSNMKTESTFNTSAATFGDGSGEMRYHDVVVDSSNVQHITNRAKVSRKGGSEQEYEDATSAFVYGPREISLSGLLMAGDGEAYDRAIWLVMTRKDPQFRVDQLTIKPGRDATNLFPKVLSYVPGQRITAVRRPGGIGSAISKQVHIESIRHSCNASSKAWTTVWQLSPVDPNEASWGVVGSGAAKNQAGTAKASY